MPDVVTQNDASDPPVAFDVAGDARGASGFYQAVISEGAKGAMVNLSGTIAAGGTAQDIYTATETIQYIFVGNPLDETESLYVDFGRNADDDGSSYELEPGDHLEFSGSWIPTGTISVMAATTGHAYTAKRGIAA